MRKLRKAEGNYVEVGIDNVRHGRILNVVFLVENIQGKIGRVILDNSVKGHIVVDEHNIVLVVHVLGLSVVSIDDGAYKERPDDGMDNLYMVWYRQA